MHKRRAIAWLAGAAVQVVLLVLAYRNDNALGLYWGAVAVALCLYMAGRNWRKR